MTERGTRYDADALEFSNRVESDPLKIGLFSQLLLRLPLPPDAVLVDLGCGPGQFLARCSEVHPQARLIGVDVSMGNLEQLRVTCPSASAVRADIAMGIPLAKNSADVVTMNFVASEMSDVTRLFSETNRVLRPGGLLAMTNTSRESDEKTLEYGSNKICITRGNFRDDEVEGKYNLRTSKKTISVPHHMRTSRHYISMLNEFDLEIIPGGIQQVIDIDPTEIGKYRFKEWFHPVAETIYARKLPDNMKTSDVFRYVARSVKHSFSPHFPYDARFQCDAVFPPGAETRSIQTASHVVWYPPALNKSLPIDDVVVKNLGISQIPSDELPTSWKNSLRQS